MSHRFGASVLVEVDAEWNQALESFTAKIRSRRGELEFELGGPGHFPTMPDFRAALLGIGVAMPAAEANRLLGDQESSTAAAARAKTARKAA